MTAVVLDGEGEELAVTTAVESGITGKEDSVIGSLKTAEVEVAAGTYYILVGATKTSSLTEHSYIFYVTAEHVHTWEQIGKDMVRLEATYQCAECDEEKTEALSEVSEIELNDSAEWAVEASFDDVYYGDVENSSANQDLEDWYKITVDERSKVIVNARSVSASLKLSIYDEDVNVLKEGADERFSITGRGYIYSMEEIVPAGTYYVVVSLTEEAEITEYHLGIAATPVEEEEPPVAEDNVYRIAGAGRYETGFAVADELKVALGVEKFEAAVPASVEAISGYTVKRLAGDSRYDTNIAILEEAGITGDEIIVATGKSFADSLSASAAKLPILLVKPNASLNNTQKAILDSMKNIYIVGGEGAVSVAYEAELKAFGSVTRVFGNSRYDTSVEIAKTFCGNVTKAVVASGKNFPDGLCGGPLAAMGAPLVLTADGKTDAAAAYTADNAIASGYVLGGDGALADETVVTVFGLESAGEIIVKKKRTA